MVDGNFKTNLTSFVTCSSS